MTIIRLKDMPKSQAALLKVLYQAVKHQPKDGQWREFRGKLKIKDRYFDLTCEYMLDDMFMTLKKQLELSDEKTKSPLILPRSYNG